MKPYYVYENWTHERARAHSGDCSFCNFGVGTQGKSSGKNDRWYVFQYKEEAEHKLTQIKKNGWKDVSWCAFRG